ncbi:DUF1127 domain-containing protein [Hansschlegelia plantiphila]|uniref:YjiS-like domain-containing protein n=1 Tax=Hansschlegelia plantiphila TaxID=374655 RepID=A0A9W6MVB5_9HYPH|nr:DUF1127 domain-containing protein [Hansschlegelia plantiphila]GLK67706.1 hypothetical protein GCM10008179_13440 [Hansschlegelia plantiphila]
MSAHCDSYRPAGAGLHRSGGAGRLLAGLRAFGASLTRRKMVEDLGRLDDRMLSDLGLTRSDLHEASRWSLWGDPTDRLNELAEERRASAALNVGG